MRYSMFCSYWKVDQINLNNVTKQRNNTFIQTHKGQKLTKFVCFF